MVEHTDFRGGVGEGGCQDYDPHALEPVAGHAGDRGTAQREPHHQRFLERFVGGEVLSQREGEGLGVWAPPLQFGLWRREGGCGWGAEAGCEPEGVVLCAGGGV